MITSFFKPKTGQEPKTAPPPPKPTASTSEPKKAPPPPKPTTSTPEEPKKAPPPPTPTAGTSEESKNPPPPPTPTASTSEPDAEAERDAVGTLADRGASGGGAGTPTETEVQPPGRKRLRKAVIRDDDEDGEDAPDEPMETDARDALVAGARRPSYSSDVSIQAFFKGRPTAASKAASLPSSKAGAAAEGGAEVGGAEAADGDAEEDAGEEEAAAEAEGSASAGWAGKKQQMTLDGRVAIAKVVASAANSKPTLLDVKAYLAYDPAAAATWAVGADVPYSFLTGVFTQIEAESKRLLITQLMANCVRTVIATSPAQLHATLCLATNKIAASYEGLELGIGDAILIKAVAETCGKSVDALKTALEEEGDLGTVACNARRKQITFSKPKPLTVRGVLAAFLELARASGKDVMTRKKERIKGMLVAARDAEAQYLVRALQGKMRIGLAEQTLLVALAHAVVLTPPALAQPAAGEAGASGEAGDDEPLSFAPGVPGGPGGTLPKGEALVSLLAEAEALVKRVYCEMPNYEVITKVLLTHGLARLHQHARLTAGIPVKPMLAKPTKGISEVLDRMSAGRFTCEFKYDGERAQIHLLPDGTIKVFSRNSEDMTQKYPDIAAVVPRATAAGVTSFIIDAEAVAVDRKSGEILPFQVLSTRKRKDVSSENITVQVCVFAFDLLFLNGEPLLREQLARRRELLKRAFGVLPHEFEFARASDVADEEGIADWLQQAIKGNCEGLMVKTLDSDATYEPSRRSLNWLKVKKDYLQGMTDSCDLVPIGAYFGKGKRTGVYGAYLLACYSEEDEEYQSVCKIGTGFSDAALHELTESLNQKRIDAPRAYYRVSDSPSLTPDVWFEPSQVWEVLAADLSISPVHQAAVGLVDPAKGIALRFPRFLRVRDDKGPEDSTNAVQIAQMYNDQSCHQASTLDEDDDY